jgi:hypothetical protein
MMARIRKWRTTTIFVITAAMITRAVVTRN